MGEPRPNPLAPAASHAIHGSELPLRGDLLPLWIWLAGAIFMGLVSAPYDPISVLLVLAFGLVSLSVGALLASNISGIPRLWVLILWLPLILFSMSPAIFSSTGHHLPWVVRIGWVIETASYGAGSVGVGYWACRRIQFGRLRIFLWFCLGCAGGTFAGMDILGPKLGLLGTAGGTVLAALLARRSLRLPEKVDAG